MKYPHLAARVFDTPLLISRQKLATVLDVLGPRMGFDVRRGEAAPAQVYAEDDNDVDGAVAVYSDGRRQYFLEDGVARIQIVGTLVHRAVGLEAMSGMSTYLDLSAAFHAAMEDENVKAILLEVDSPGGEANGCFDFADEIYAARGEKPIWAVAVDWADSGAYLIASAADRVIVTQSGEVGSIGVAWCHVDYSEQNKMLGTAVTYIYAGERKMDGWPDKPLSEPARARFQADVDKRYAAFVAAVARNRGLSEDAVRATQALTYLGADGVAVGLADAVGTLRESIELLAEQAQPSMMLSGPTDRAVYAQSMEPFMSGKTNAPAGAEPAGAQPAVAIDVDAVRREAVTQTQSAERARIGAIIGCDEAKGREDLARHLAFDTDMTAEAAKLALAKAPVAAAETQTNPLAAAMKAAGNPQVGPDNAAQQDEDPAQVAAAIVSAVRGRATTQQRSN